MAQCVVEQIAEDLSDAVGIDVDLSGVLQLCHEFHSLGGVAVVRHVDRGGGQPCGVHIGRGDVQALFGT